MFRAQRAKGHRFIHRRGTESKIKPPDKKQWSAPEKKLRQRSALTKQWLRRAWNCEQKLAPFLLLLYSGRRGLCTLALSKHGFGRDIPNSIINSFF